MIDLEVDIVDLDLFLSPPKPEDDFHPGESVPEINRLEDFIKSIESELRISENDLVQEHTHNQKFEDNNEEDDDNKGSMLSLHTPNATTNWTATIKSPFLDISQESFMNESTASASTVGQSNHELKLNVSDVSSAWLDTSSFLSTASKRTSNQLWPQNFLSPVTPILQTPQSGVDAFLLALERAGYTNLQLSASTNQIAESSSAQKAPRESLSALADYHYDYFFAPTFGQDSLEEDKARALAVLSSPNRYNTSQLPPEGPTITRSLYQQNDNLSLFPASLFPSPSDQAYIVTKLQRNLIAKEEFTVEALRRNWDREEDSDEEEGEAPETDEEAHTEEIDQADSLQVKKYANRDNSSTNVFESINNFPLSEQKKPPLHSTNNHYNTNKNKTAEEQNEEEEEDNALYTKAENQSTTNAATSSSSAVGGLEDLRLHGDFSVMSHGEKLNGEYLAKHYVGLYATAMSHYNDQGRLVPLGALLDTTAAANTTTTISRLTNSTSAKTVPTSAQALPNPLNTGYYALYFMECVLRPDVECAEIFAMLMKVFKLWKYKLHTFQRHHVKVYPTKHAVLQYVKDQGLLRSNGNNVPTKGNNKLHDMVDGLTQFLANAVTTNQNNTSASVQDTLMQEEMLKQFPFEWDHIDVQLAIARDVRQRVLVLQFLKKVPTILPLPSNTTTVTSSTAAAASAVSSGFLSVEYIPINQSPMTKKLMSGLKKAIINKQYSLSCLYHVPIKEVCRLPYGLDNHFLAQLNSLCRDQLWTKLQSDYHEMEEYLVSQEQQCAVFYKAMESMYKLYALKFPAFWSREQAIKKDKMMKKPTVVVPPIENEFTSPSRPVTSSTAASLPAFSNPPSPTSDRNSNTFATPDRNNKSSSAPITPSMHTPNHRNDALQQVPMTPNTRMNQYMKTLLSSSRKIDGMTFCLVMLDKCYQELQDKCDTEYTNKIQERHELTFGLVQQITEFKYNLLNMIYYSNPARRSNFMATFFQTFHGVQLTTEQSATATQQPNTAAANATNKANISTKPTAGPTNNTKASSWFGNLGETLTNIVIPSNPATTSSSSSSVQTKPKPQPLSLPTSSPPASKKKVVKFTLQDQVVFYYCSVLVGTTPGTLYLTTDYLCLISSVLGLNQKKEIYGLADLTDIILPNQTENTVTAPATGTLTLAASSLLNSRTMKLVFFHIKHKKEIVISPAVDCVTLRMMVLEVQKHSLLQRQQEQQK